MIKKLQNLSFLLVFLIPIYAFSQVGIGTTSPDNSSILDLSSSNRGLLIPRLNLVATSNTAPVTSPAEGLLVYNLATVNDVTPGLYYWNGSLWISAKAGSGAGSASGWALNGNNLNDRANDGSTFLGTTSYHDLYLKLNNQQIGRLQPNGGVALGLGASSSANQAFAIGESASAGNTSNYAFGKGANASGSNAYALGEGSASSQNKSYALGQSSNASGTSAYAIGESSRAQGTNSYAIGAAARSGATGSFAFGNGALSTSNNTLALGNESQATNNNSTALGYRAVSSHQNAVAIGPAQTAVDNTIILGNTTNTTVDAYAATKVGIGTSNPTAKLQVDGTLRYVDGNQLNGRVLTTDDDGNATWQEVKPVTRYGDRYLNYDFTVGNSNLVKIPFNVNTITPEGIVFNNADAFPAGNGIYRITYSVSLIKSGTSGGTTTPVEIRLYNGNNLIPAGSITLIPTFSGQPATATKSVLITYSGNAGVGIYVSKDNGNRNLIVLENSNFNIELVRSL
ncbi:hypothetical protein [Leeuwenhoekiella nanhaiensis]|uniref:Trimeric autotransporter adhesin YadA-like head domain-containing protein n=1 Tax=Leeuwenhoekiella nanhaiensis TaxID=1655491 RepID=A0A2G1VPU7_9FLAO|nr:hypothetical protein [Leeuwenhoekiella nanhaiensis]PHQ28773.1 hypothetical protein CJ305_13220 [Leeuwenhoekiella nanhaiensis]